MIRKFNRDCSLGVVASIFDVGTRFGSTKLATVIIRPALIVAVLSALMGTLPAQAQTETVLHSFHGWPDDGYNPGYGSLVSDGAGNLYGTTISGGAVRRRDRI